MSDSVTENLLDTVQCRLNMIAAGNSLFIGAVSERNTGPSFLVVKHKPIKQPSDGLILPRERHVPQSTPSAAPVHIDRVRGHKLASVGTNEKNQFADLLRFAKALHRHVVEELLDQLG